MIIETLGPRLRQAVQEHLGRPVQGMAIISSHDNLFLVGADLGNETRRVFASVYVKDDGSYWKIEDFSDSNRILLDLLRAEDGKEIDYSDLAG